MRNKSLYHILVPKFIRKRKKDDQIKKTILDYYHSLPDTAINQEEKEAINYLENNNLCYFPYPFQNQYKQKDIIIYWDKSLKLNYVLSEGKRLYFKRNTSAHGIKRVYNNLIIEQDIDSPHRYLTPAFEMHQDDILADVGTAEGNLPLSVIEKVKKAYLFETDEDWIEALRATFSPYKDKVEIINTFVSDKNEGSFASLDEFFRNKQHYTFLKIDVEGAEEQVLNGCNIMLSSTKPGKLLVCCYHRPNDEFKFYNILVQKGFTVSFSKGYMIYTEPGTFYPPYLRRGVLRAERQ